MTELPSLRPERPLGMWAFWSSLATLFLLASTILFFGLGFCIGSSCRSIPAIYGLLTGLSALGSLASIIATVSLAI